MSEMDAVDSRQQQEIEDLKKRASDNREVDHLQWQEISDLHSKDAVHDALIGVLKIAIAVIIVNTFVTWFALFFIVNAKP